MLLHPRLLGLLLELVLLTLSQSGERGTKDLQGSMGWAASPMRTRRDLCHVGRGSRDNSAHSLMSSAFLGVFSMRSKRRRKPNT